MHLKSGEIGIQIEQNALIASKVSRNTALPLKTTMRYLQNRAEHVLYVAARLLFPGLSTSASTTVTLLALCADCCVDFVTRPSD